MSALIAISILVLLGLVVLVVSGPLRGSRQDSPGEGQIAGPGTTESPAPSSFEHDDLEAAREAKYREIRDLELDFRTGKLSQEDYQATDAQLRAEALELLNRIEAEEARSRRAAPELSVSAQGEAEASGPEPGEDGPDE